MSLDLRPTDDTAPDLQQPLSCTWREWIVRPPRERAVDAIVVGSGYGGSVAALRLAEKGYRVLLLERGSEYLPGDFPNDFSGVPKHFRLNIPGRGVPVGRASGLIEVSVGQGMVAITGNGLGGGSLINAGVVVRPDPDVFAQEAWPGAIRHHRDIGPRSLQEAFELAEKTLQGHVYRPPAADHLLCKTVALHRVAERLSEGHEPLQTQPAKLTIDPDKCRACGDCVSGCNVPGAKLTLSTSYLSAALKTQRVQIVTQAQVYRFEPCTEGQHRQWKLTVFATDAQHQVLTQREAAAALVEGPAGDPGHTQRELRASMLVIAAGTLGSTQLLQRSQALSGEALAFSQALGTRLSGNGDSVSIKTAEAQRVNAVGHGADAELRALERRDPAQQHKLVGPTITTHLDLRDRSKPLDQRILLQDGAIPGAIARPFAELLATAYSVSQLGRGWFRNPQPRTGPARDPLAASRAMAQHTQIFLAMGHDGSPGRMVWLPGLDTSAPVFSGAEHLRTYVEQQRLFDRLRPAGTHVHSPLWRWLPENMSRFFLGAQPTATVTTVHPLGGCPMGDDPQTSVVNHRGQVWIHEPAEPRRQGKQPAPPLRPNQPQVYDGLYVLDGSIVPTSLGCNPLLTITALAERAMAHVAVRQHRPRRTQAAHVSAARPRAHFETPRFCRDVSLGETLRSNGDALGDGATALRGPWMRGKDDERRCLVFKARLDSDHFEKTLIEPDHRMAIRQASLCLLRMPEHDGLASPPLPPEELVTYQATEGRFEFLRANALSSGPWLPLLCLLQGLAFLMAALAPVWARGLLLVCWPALVLLACALPYPRTFFTWFALRGWSDIRFHPSPLTGWKRFKSWPAYILQLLTQLAHASEKRHMHYRVAFKRQGHDPGGAVFPAHVIMTARKRVTYRASVVEWARWLARHAWRRTRLPGSKAEIPPLRPGLWAQVMDADIRVWRGTPHLSRPLAHGRMAMGQDNLFDRAMAQLGQKGDTTSGLVLLAGYPLLLARFAIKTRLLDFRLPNFSHRPVSDVADAHDMRIRNSDDDEDFCTPEPHMFVVPRGTSSSDQGTENMDGLSLRLWRYRSTKGDGGKPPVEPGLWQDQKVRRARSVLLLHAFGQSGLSFTHQASESKAGSNLAEAFHHAGYEVWVLDSRMSTRSGYAGDASTVDMQARHDVPLAVDRILGILADELGSGPPVQISAFAQCIGAASLWMALLDGRLSHEPPLERTACATPRLSKIASVAFSQVHALTMGKPVPRAKSWLPGLLQALAPRGVIPFAVRGAQDSVALNFLDRLLSTLPVPAAERAHAKNEDSLATCKRIRFIEAPLFRHENLHPSTVAQMNRLFGEANIRLFAQARRFLERGRLVDEDGVNRYVTDDNIRAHLTMPVQLLHGEKNELFDLRSAIDTDELLTRLDCKKFEHIPRPLRVPGYGHLDVLFGIDAGKKVFKPLLEFFDQAQTYTAAPGEAARDGLLLRAPLVGPWLGKLEERDGQRLARVVFLVDDLHGGSRDRDGITRVVVRQRQADGRYRQLPEVAHGFFEVDAYDPAAADDRPDGVPLQRAYRTAWIDVPLTDDARSFQVFTAHPVHRSSSQQQETPWAQLDITRVPAFVPPRLSIPPLDLGERYRSWTPCTRFLPERVLSERVLSVGVDDETIDLELTKNQNDFAAYELTWRTDGMPIESAMQQRCHVELPESSLNALRRDATAVQFVAASCRHPGLDVDATRTDRVLAPYEAPTDAAFALLVGDQIYADATAGLVDPLSPAERYLERYELAFGPRGMGHFLSHTPTYMVPDDHEWTDAQPNGSPLLKWSWSDRAKDKPYRAQEKAIYRWAGNALTAFQRSLSWPLDYLWQEDPRDRPGVTEHRHGCVNLVLIDSRSWRNRQVEGSAAARVMDAIAFQSLLDSLYQSRNSGLLQVIVTGSVVIPGLYPNADPANPGVSDTWQYAPEQRLRLLDALVKHHPRRFLLISGDYHVSGALSLQLNGRTVGAAIVAPPIYAPLPYANAAPEHVFTRESLALPSGLLTQQVCEGGQVRRGNGVAHIGVERLGEDYRIVCKRKLTVLEVGRDTESDCEIAL
ncbi:GMC oxidoreductase [Hydrogenophaga sp. BPS33]|uniref:GMC oxidoreductase n=1 Tax=Hydrogenophaga sp. BPS33 TaxID=2651974 RepID=UPI00131FC311|nr:GMC oxidoreductase [Hydrogenophaga sp. BPS33]QHE86612.1 NAD(P)-binding protein [Hydrogenophaga sp. BPS33]